MTIYLVVENWKLLAVNAVRVCDDMAFGWRVFSRRVLYPWPCDLIYCWWSRIRSVDFIGNEFSTTNRTSITVITHTEQQITKTLAESCIQVAWTKLMNLCRKNAPTIHSPLNISNHEGSWTNNALADKYWIIFVSFWWRNPLNGRRRYGGFEAMQSVNKNELWPARQYILDVSSARKQNWNSSLHLFALGTVDVDDAWDGAKMIGELEVTDVDLNIVFIVQMILKSTIWTKLNSMLLLMRQLLFCDPDIWLDTSMVHQPTIRIT